MADDDKISRKIMSRLIELAGHSVDVAHDGQEALDRWSSREYDLIFLDLQMPILNGFEVARAIRSQETRTPRIPIVAVTGHSGKEKKQAILAAGMNGQITKPITRESLAEALEQWAR